MKCVTLFSILTLLLFSSGTAAAQSGINGTAKTTVSSAVSPRDIELTVFPNPATAYIEVTASGPMDEVVILNTLGATVLREKTNGSNSVRIQVDDLPKGVYLLQCNGTTKRFVKK